MQRRDRDNDEIPGCCNFLPGLHLSVTYDITGRKRNEEELRISDERFRAIVTTSSDGILCMSPDGSEMYQLFSRVFPVDAERPKTNWPLLGYARSEDLSLKMYLLELKKIV